MGTGGHVCIVGGGVSSLLLGVELRERLPQVGVTLLTADTPERLGGHLAVWDEDGYPIEHGFHAFFGFYDAILPTLRRLGLLGGFTRSSDVVFIHENGTLHPLSRGKLLGFRGFGLRQRAALLSGIPALARILRDARGDGLDGLDRLDGHDLRELGRLLGMGPAFLESNFVRMFYDFGFNGPEPMSAAVGLQVVGKLREQPFLYHFNAPADVTLVRPLARRFEALGGELCHRQRLQRVEIAPDGRRATSIVVEDEAGVSTTRPVDRLVLGLDLERFQALDFSGPGRDLGFVRDAARLRGVASISLQAWFERDPVPAFVDNVIGGLPEPFSVACPVTRVRREARGRHGYEIIAVGPEAGFEDTRDEVLADRFFTTLRRLGFSIPEALRGVHVHVHRNRALGGRYLLTAPGELGLRPRPRTPVENLFLVGAWLRNAFGMPSIQGAAQSVHEVAGALERHYADRGSRRVEDVAAPPSELRPRWSAMPSLAPLYAPPPYHHRGHVHAFVADVAPGVLGELVPPALSPLPGFADRAVILLTHYDRARSLRDETGAVYAFNEVVIAAPVQDRRARPGLFPVVVYLDSDVALSVGREVYGYPKKLAAIEIEDGAITLTRDGLRPDEPPGLVRPLPILRGTWSTAAGAGAPEALWRAFGLHGARELARRLNLGEGLIVYNHQILPAPPGASAPEGISRVLAAPLTEITIEEAVPLAAATFVLEPSLLDPLHRLLPEGKGALRARVGARFQVSFTVSAAERVLEERRPSAAARATGAAPTEEPLREGGLA